MKIISDAKAALDGNNTSNVKGDSESDGSSNVEAASNVKGDSKSDGNSNVEAASNVDGTSDVNGTTEVNGAVPLKEDPDVDCMPDTKNISTVDGDSKVITNSKVHNACGMDAASDVNDSESGVEDASGYEQQRKNTACHNQIDFSTEDASSTCEATAKTNSKTVTAAFMQTREVLESSENSPKNKSTKDSLNSTVFEGKSNSEGKVKSQAIPYADEDAANTKQMEGQNSAQKDEPHGLHTHGEALSTIAALPKTGSTISHGSNSSLNPNFSSASYNEELQDVDESAGTAHASRLSSYLLGMKSMQSLLLPAFKGRAVGKAMEDSPFTKQDDKILLISYSLNQDGSCFMCTTTDGFRVYTCCPLQEFERKEGYAWTTGGFIVGQMVFRSSVSALVGMVERKKLLLWDDAEKKIFYEIRNRLDIVQVVVKEDIVAVVTAHDINLYSGNNFENFHQIYTRYNPLGLCSVYSERSCNTLTWKVACPANLIGAVNYNSSVGRWCDRVFQAHKTELSFMAFNVDGKFLATASSMGTMVRVFDSEAGVQMYEYRLGTNKHEISCISFREDNQLLAVASTSSTVHIFKLADTEKIVHKTESQPSSSGEESESSNERISVKQNAGSPDLTSIGASAQNFLTHLGTTVAPLINTLQEHAFVAYESRIEGVREVLKGVLPTYFKPQRSIAQCRLPRDFQSLDFRSSTSTIVGPLCAFAGKSSNKLYVLHLNGIFYEFLFDPKNKKPTVMLAATSWFSSRRNFQIQPYRGNGTRASDLEGGYEGDDWQIIL